MTSVKQVQETVREWVVLIMILLQQTDSPGQTGISKKGIN